MFVIVKLMQVYLITVMNQIIDKKPNGEGALILFYFQESAYVDPSHDRICHPGRSHV